MIIVVRVIIVTISDSICWSLRKVYLKWIWKLVFLVQVLEKMECQLPLLK